VAQRELDHLGQALGWSGEQLQVAAVRQNEGPGNALLATLAYEHLGEVFTQFGRRASAPKRWRMTWRARCAATKAAGPRWARTWPTNGLPLALAVWRGGRGASYACTELTPHARSNFEVIERFVPVRFATDATGDGWRVSLSPA
jgi:RNA 3'-terminal phosphate cyclase (ATP)